MGNLSTTDEALLGSVGLPTQGSLRLPGATYASALAAQEALQENHVRFDWQFTSNGLHNHLAHAVLASYSLGAGPELIKDIYKLHALAQRPMPAIRNRMISYQNWTRFLGQDDYYSSYLVFFSKEIEKYGAAPTVERYLFKFREGRLLDRTVSGALHPLIQLGHGVEFGLDALVAEGLAFACVHTPRTSILFPPGWPAGSSATANQASALSGAFSRLNSLKSALPSALKRQENRYAPSSDSFSGTALRLDPNRPRHPRLGLSGFTVLSHILSDPRLAAGQASKMDVSSHFVQTLEDRGDLIRQWCEEWIVDEAGGWREVVEKTEELFWIATVLVGASTRPGYKPRMDFFLMHGLTSAIFLPSILEVLSPSSRIALLHTHFRVMIAYWISRGRPYLYITECLMAASAQAKSPRSVPYDQGNIAQTLQRGGTAEVDMHNKDVDEQRKKAGQPNGQSSAAPPSRPTTPPSSDNRPAFTIGRDRSDSQVDIPLDTPVKEERTFALPPVENGDEDEQKHGDGNGDMARAGSTDSNASNIDGARTPTLTNGHAFTNPYSRRDQSDKKRQQQQPSSASAWAEIIASAVDHSDEHTTKVIRSLAFAAQHFGMSPPGVFRSSLAGTELMDGSIFIRLAGTLLNSLGWAHEGQKVGQWDRSMLGFDEAWKDEACDFSYEAVRSPVSASFDVQRDFQQSFVKKDKGKGRAMEE